jgi:hypothetical protein
MMFTARDSSKKRIPLEPELIAAQRSWIALQARQLQRIGLEALLVWVENEIDESDGCADARSLYEAADRLAPKDSGAAKKSKDVKGYYSRIEKLGQPYGWPDAAGLGGEADIFSLIDRIIKAQVDESYDQLPSLALNAIFSAAIICDALRNLGAAANQSNLTGGPSDRLPLSHALRVIHRMADESLGALWREIIESWVLGQHVRWAVARSGDETQRLRVAIDEGGWIRLRSKMSGPFRPTPDRLNTALALSSDCGLLKRMNNMPQFALP